MDPGHLDDATSWPFHLVPALFSGRLLPHGGRDEHQLFQAPLVTSSITPAKRECLSPDKPSKIYEWGQVWITSPLLKSKARLAPPN